MKGKSQTQMVLEHLQTIGAISSYEAFKRYGVTRLSAIIFNLRKRDYCICSEQRTAVNRYGTCCNFVVYRLIEEKKDE